MSLPPATRETQGAEAAQAAIGPDTGARASTEATAATDKQRLMTVANAVGSSIVTRTVRASCERSVRASERELGVAADEQGGGDGEHESAVSDKQCDAGSGGEAVRAVGELEE